ncbi:hypothetical protein D3C75_595580 [compost metagenome]
MDIHFGEQADAIIEGAATVEVAVAIIAVDIVQQFVRLLLGTNIETVVQCGQVIDLDTIAKLERASIGCGHCQSTYGTAKQAEFEMMRQAGQAACLVFVIHQFSSSWRTLVIVVLIRP